MTDSEGIPRKHGRVLVWAGRIFKVLLSILIVGAGVATATYLNNTGPKSKKRPRAKLAPVVQVEPLQVSTHRVTIAAMGTVIPAREVVLNSRISGQVVEVHPSFTAGGVVEAGTEVLRLDREDYVLALAQKRSAVADAEAALKLELGHQDVARREWELLNKGKPAAETEADLALRKPHLNKAKAAVDAASAQMKKARLDLARTSITVPFNALVRSTSVELGSQVSSQGPLAELVGTDAFWVRASVPVDRIEWIDIPGEPGAAGSKVRIIYGGDSECSGTVRRLLGDLGTEGRMARVLVEVEDPLGLRPGSPKPAPLLLGQYVAVEIEGDALDEVFRIPRSALRDNGTVWVVDEQGMLHIRQVEAVWRDAHVVLIRDGFEPGERLIVSDISGPVEGMRVRVASAAAAGPARPGAAIEHRADEQKTP